MYAQWAIHESGASDLGFRPNAQALCLHMLGCCRIHNRSANSRPHSRLDIMDIKPPTAGCQGRELKIESCGRAFPFSTLSFNMQRSWLTPYPATLTAHAADKSNSCHSYKNTGGGGTLGLFDTLTLRLLDCGRRFLLFARRGPRPRLTRCANSSTLLTSISTGKLPSGWNLHRTTSSQGDCA